MAEHAVVTARDITKSFGSLEAVKGISFDVHQKEFDGIVEQASEQELSDAAAMVDRTGTFNCPHTGVALAVFLKLKERDFFKPSDKVIIISTAHGLKFIEFKIGYHNGSLENIAPKFPNMPIELPAELGAVKRAIFENLERRANPV